MRSPNSMYSLLHLEMGLLRDSLTSMEDEQNRHMISLKLQNKRVIEAIAKLEILAAVVNDFSMMDSSVRAQSGASTKVESLEVLVQEKSPIQFASGKIRDDGEISGFRDSVASKNNNRDESNTVDTCLEFSTSRPSLANKRAKNRKVSNVDLDDLATSAHHHLLSSNKATDEESPHSSPSPLFQEKGCPHSTSLQRTDDAV